MPIPNEIREAFTRFATDDPIFWIWAFDPQTGEVLIDDTEGDNHDQVSHEDFARIITHPERVHGYAHRILNGWRITDWEHKSLDDKYILNQVHKALKGGSTKTALYNHESAHSKWAWVEGLPVLKWTDDEVGYEASEEDINSEMKQQGLKTNEREQAWEDGEAENFLPTIAHIEKLVELGLQAGVEELRSFEGERYTSLEWGNVLDALDTAGLKWAVGLMGHTEEGDKVQVGAKAPATTQVDIEQNVGGIDHKAEDGRDSYALKQEWNFTEPGKSFSHLR